MLEKVEKSVGGKGYGPEVKRRFLDLFRIHRCNVEKAARTLGIDRHTVIAWRDSDPEFLREFEEIHQQVKDLMEAKLIDLTDLADLPDLPEGVKRSDHKALLAAGVDHKLLSVGLKSLERWLISRHDKYRMYNKIQLGDKTVINKAQIVIMGGEERKQLNEMAKELCRSKAVTESFNVRVDGESGGENTESE